MILPDDIREALDLAHDALSQAQDVEDCESLAHAALLCIENARANHSDTPLQAARAVPWEAVYAGTHMPPHCVFHPTDGEDTELWAWRDGTINTYHCSSDNWTICQAAVACYRYAGDDKWTLTRWRYYSSSGMREFDLLSEGKR